MKKTYPFFFLFFIFQLVSIFTGPRVGGNPFFLSLNRTHPFEIIWCSASSCDIGGMGKGWTLGLPCQFLIVDTGSIGAARARIVGEPENNRIDSWRFKLDLARFFADILIVFVTTLFLSKVLALLLVQLRPRLVNT